MAESRDFPLTVIEPRSSSTSMDWGELWRFREFIWMLAVRDIKVRYRQTVIGVSWVVLQPLMMMFILTALFSLIGAKPSRSLVPYPLIVLSGLVIWRLFSNILTQSSESVVSNQHLVTKIYCPRLVFPLGGALSSLVELGVCLGLLAVVMLWYGVVPGWKIFWLPLFVTMGILTGLSLGILFAALGTLYRDLRHVVPFLLQILYYVSPVMYETNAVVAPRWQVLYALNPLVGVIEGFRWSLLGTDAPRWSLMMVSMGAVAGLLWGAVSLFQRMERRFADWI